jgi:L-ascorbate metabolism protein UlaG (beta-lactamase superfamily)
MAGISPRITYVGGPTAVVEFGGIRLLTDPTFDPAGSDYTTGPVTLRKTRGPWIPPDHVGPIDVVLLSHDHHADNFDRAGREVAAQAGLVVTTAEGAPRVSPAAIGLRAWESTDVAAPGGRTLRITATPARHGPAHMDRGPVIGFVLAFTDAPEDAIYFSGDTVWFEGVEEVARRFRIRTALLNIGAARVEAVGPWHLTMTAEEAVLVARAFPEAEIVPLHFEGWEHFSESRAEIEKAFEDAGLSSRLRWAS